MKVSVLMITYNHEEFIEEAIESVLMQKTNFEYELVIGEDCSTDNTRNIVKAYKEKYPNIIKLNLQESNVRGRKNFISTFSLCRGEYIALLEGDDYWIDEYKLQKQVDFLDTNTDFTYCGHSYKRYYQDSQSYLGKIMYDDEEFILDDLLIADISNEGNKFILRTFTVMFRKYILDNPPSIWDKVPYGDYLIQILALEKGKGKALKDIMGVYRINENSITQKNAREFLKLNIQLRKYILGYVSDEYKSYVQESINNKILKDGYFELVDNFRSNIYDKEIVDYFFKNDLKNIGVYGVGTLGNLLISKLEGSNIVISYFIDKNMVSSGGKVIIKPDNIEGDLNVDAIIVTPTYDFDNIKKSLEMKVVNTKIISLQDVLIEDISC